MDTEGIHIVKANQNAQQIPHSHFLQTPAIRNCFTGNEKSFHSIARFGFNEGSLFSTLGLKRSDSRIRKNSLA